LIGWFRRSRSGVLGGELRVRRAEAGVAAAAAGDQDLVAGGGALHPVAEVASELVGAEGDLVGSGEWS
jgi:hypothetical protein